MFNLSQILFISQFLNISIFLLMQTNSCHITGITQSSQAVPVIISCIYVGFSFLTGYNIVFLLKGIALITAYISC